MRAVRRRQLVGRGVSASSAACRTAPAWRRFRRCSSAASASSISSADYRLRDPNVYAQWYGESHHDLANLAQAVYGLPELYGDEIPRAQLIANPGCYPQTAILGLAPLVAGKYIELNGHHHRQQERRLRRGPDAEAEHPLPRVQRERVGLQRRHSTATRRRSSRP